MQGKGTVILQTNRHDIIAYFNALDRNDFMEADKNVHTGDADAPVSIGFGQTISQPTLVLDMTLALDPQPDARVLEIGTGSGYQTALLAPFCREVYTVERLSKLHQQAKERLEKKSYTNVHFLFGDGNKGWPAHQPYDRIIVTAATERVPDALIGQLAKGGRMLIPVGTYFMQELQLVEKDINGEITSWVLYGVRFVQLKEGNE